MSSYRTFRLVFIEQCVKTSMLTRTIKYLILGLAFCFCHLSLLAQNKKIDSLLTLTNTDNADTNKVNHFNQLCIEYIKIGKYDSGLKLGNKALALASSLPIGNRKGWYKGISSAYNNIGVIYENQSEYTQALGYYIKALKINEEVGNKNETVADLSYIGNIYENQGEYPKALDYYFKALKIDEKLNNKKRIAKHLCNIGIVYRNQADYPKALDYYFKALKIAEELGDKNGITLYSGNIGNVYWNQANYSLAEYYYFKGLKMAEELGNKNYQAIFISNIGNVYYSKKNYPKTIAYYYKALKMAEELKNKKEIARHLGNLGELYTKIGKFKEAEQYLKKSIAMADSIGALNYLRIYENVLSQLYDTTRRYKEALIQYKKAVALKDTIFSQENKKQLVRKEMNYEFDKKNIAAKAQQNMKDAITAEEKQRAKVIIYSVSVGLFLVLLLALFIFRGYRQKRKANFIITQQKEIVEKKNKLIEEKQKEILASITYAQRIQRAMLPHRRDIWAAFPHSFVLFKPKDIVSGDFYFFHKSLPPLIAVADCTGHGVPGAFMSMVGAGKLNDAVSQSADTSEILSLLNKGIKTALKQSEGDKATRDGMDIALCSVDTENCIIQYVAANRPIYIIRKGNTNVEEIKATKKAIGGFTEDAQHFETHEIKLQQGDTFYLSTDGYADQFGGEEGKKLMTKKFKEILLDIQDKTMQEQEKYLDTFADNWRGKREQIDDILVIGVRL